MDSPRETSAETRQDTRSEIRRAAILDAALEIFTDYGYRRASLEDIARRAEISRTGVYHHFSSKEDVFEAMVERCHELTHAEAVAVLNSDEPLEDRLLASMEVKLGFFFKKAMSTRHGRQVLSMGYRIGSDVTRVWTGHYLDAMAETFEKAAADGEIDLSRIGASARTAAGFMLLNAEGQQGPANGPPDVGRYSARLRRLVRMTLLSLGGNVRPGF